MTQIENSTLGIVGAGSVGASLAYAALIRGSARHVRLLDINAPKVTSEVLDLAHGTQFTGSSDITGGTDIDVLTGANVVVITAGAKQKPGQTRLDLAATNAAMLRSLMPQLIERAPDAIYVLVTNPCDVLTMVAQEATGLPAQRVLSSGTVLDTSRLRWLLAKKAGVSTSSVHALIVGEHGDSEFPLWGSATIGQSPILDWVNPDGSRFSPAELDHIATDVRDAAYQVIRGKGATNYAIGLSGARIVEAILSDEGSILPVSTVLTDYHGVSGAALSVPCRVGSAGAIPVAGTPWGDEERRRLLASAVAVTDAYGKVAVG
ncbi:L-lactate dehydrogenase [Neomicrococcus aestuarii]|uniref:L-lactate dehydrogenase n=1 Tax=Neomicrococcus aestuarii TaxID=556325 RepID=A0A7W8TUX2_9MICC|nr:L-lactate dehydrogenase [Neomicrococcus aestuarii]MBB5513233.1 L-lactate dehydrogenase [Neomicrococcus aestuarii]